MEDSGTKFLHERNPNFHTSQEVEGVVDYLRANGERIPNEPAKKIESYLGFLANADYVNDGILTGNEESIDRQIEAHIIKSEDVPEQYFELQRRIAREQGHGNIRITEAMREQLVEAIQSDQRSGLAKWVEYLGGDDGSYPNWFKHYTWNSVTKLGNYDKEKGEFLKRSKGTTAPYPELNREALAYVFDAVHKKAKGENIDEANDVQLQKLLQAANFGKLYSHAVLKLQPATPEQKENIEGSWTKYERSNDPRTARRLAGSLQGHGTGWCTAGESTAEVQLKNGDFYVYYTNDEDGKDTVPRVAIRMQGGKVAEVRGINHSQELEPVMTDIAMERLKELPGGEEYTQKAEDMKRLTTLEKKLNDNPEIDLTPDDVVFLYELERSIRGFGYDKDPRIDELVGKRNLVQDLAVLFDTDPKNSQATVTALIEAQQKRKYLGLSLERVINHSTGLSPDLAQLLIDTGNINILRKHLNSFEGLSDSMAQHFIEDIRGIDIPSFSQLSEDTFFRLVDEFEKPGKQRSNYGIDDQTYTWRLLEKAAAGKFDLPDHQRVAERLMARGLWNEAARAPQYFRDLDTRAISDRFIAENKEFLIAIHLENFPNINHQEFADYMLDKNPESLATNLGKFDVDRSFYARKLIEAGKIYFLNTFIRIEGLDQDVVEQLDAYREKLKAEEKARDEREKALMQQHANWAKLEEERRANWDDSWGDYYA